MTAAVRVKLAAGGKFRARLTLPVAGAALTVSRLARRLTYRAEREDLTGLFALLAVRCLLPVCEALTRSMWAIRGRRDG